MVFARLVLGLETRLAVTSVIYSRLHDEINDIGMAKKLMFLLIQHNCIIICIYIAHSLCLCISCTGGAGRSWV